MVKIKLREFFIFFEGSDKEDRAVLRECFYKQGVSF
jgi:hypothetical protein